MGKLHGGCAGAFDPNRHERLWLDGLTEIGHNYFLYRAAVGPELKYGGMP